MSCHDLEGLIALNVEGDLGESERQFVEAHLSGCLVCRQLAQELRESQAAFKSMRQEVADQVALSSVRARVLVDIAGMDSGSWIERLFLGGLRQKATLAGIAALLVGGTILWLGREKHEVLDKHLPTMTTIATLPPTPVIASGTEFEVSIADRPPAAKPRRRSNPVKAPQEPQPQVTIKLVTDDPNVIIYWLGEEKGE